MRQEIAVHEHPAIANMGFLRVNNFTEAIQLGEHIKKSGFAPKGMTVIDIVLSIQMGLELGLPPMQALQNISVINGKPSIYGDLMLALCKNHKDWEWCSEEYHSERHTAVCVVKRKGEPEVVCEFSMEQAKKARLSGKTGPWSDYPERMLQMRARGFALRDAFPDALKGLISVEEARDYPKSEPKPIPQVQSGHTIDVEPSPNPEPMSSNTFEKIIGTLAELDIQQAVVNKWLSKAGVNSIGEMSEDQGQGIVRWLQEKTVEMMHQEQEMTQAQWDEDEVA
jgi:hypothetical protein